MKTQRRAINKNIFRIALNATAQKRTSLAALRDQDKILQTIQTDTIMRQRWERYCKENYYANGIEFDDAIGVLKELVN